MRKDSTPRICEHPECNNTLAAWHQKRFCSRTCARRFNVTAYPQKKTGQNFVCEACGKSFYRYQADITKATKNNSRVRYCSKPCADGVKSSTNVSLTCPQCRKPFEVWASRITERENRGRKATYCSAKCRDAAMSEDRKKSITILCLACGKSFTRIPSRMVKRNFCSRACMATQIATWNRGRGAGKWGHRDDLGHFVRSSWEANICRVLVALNIPYEYEPRTFSLPSGNTYRPDLFVAGRFWVEVKGWLRKDAAAKIAEFRSAYPEHMLIVLDQDIYRSLEVTFGMILPDWEHPYDNWGKRKHAALFVAHEEAHSVA